MNDYLYAAQNLVNRTKDKLNVNSDPEKLEIDRLFFWILKELNKNIENSSNTKKVYSITVKEAISLNHVVILKNGDIADYSSKYVNKMQFYIVMQKVADIFNSMECYTAEFRNPMKKDNYYAYLKVCLEINE